MSMESAPFSKLVVSGFISKEANFAEPFVFSKLYESDTTRWTSITALADDIGFAKKRMVNPTNVYNGLVDILGYSEFRAESDLDVSLATHDAWLGFNVSIAQLPVYAALAAKYKLRRVVFGVHVPSDMRGPDVVFEEAQKTLAEAGTAFTIIKFGDVRKMGEAKYPYRIMRGALPLPEESETGNALSSEDLMRVLAESVDLPKTFGQVYGIGAGSRLDSEILVYMKSQGWPERVQVGLLMGDMMEKVEKKYLEERKSESTPALKAPKEELAKKNAFAGFFQ